MAPRDVLKNINSRLAELLLDAKRALQGECDFGVEEIEKLRVPIEAMAPIMAQSATLKKLHPELVEPLNEYKSQLRDLDRTLEKIRMMLLARQASLEAGRSQLAAVSQWVSVMRQTR